MANEEAKKILLARIGCMERQIDGCVDYVNWDCVNCKLLYEQGTMDEFIEALKVASEALIKAEGGEA